MKKERRKCIDTTCIYHSKIFTDVCNIDFNTVGITFEKDCPFEIVKRHSIKPYNQVIEMEKEDLLKYFYDKIIEKLKNREYKQFEKEPWEYWFELEIVNEKSKSVDVKVLLRKANGICLFYLYTITIGDFEFYKPDITIFNKKKSKSKRWLNLESVAKGARYYELSIKYKAENEEDNKKISELIGVNLAVR